MALKRKRLPGQFRRIIAANQAKFVRLFMSIFIGLLVIRSYESDRFGFLMTSQLKYFFDLRGPVAFPKEILLLKDDSQSLRALDANPLTPLNRKHFAKLAENLARGGAKLLVFDYVFEEYSGREEETEIFAKALKKIPTSVANFTLLNDELQADGSVIGKFTVYNSDPVILESAMFNTSMLARVDKSGQASRFYIQRIENGAKLKQPKVPLLIPTRFYSGNPQLPQPSEFDFINYYGPTGFVHSRSMSDYILNPSEEDLAFIKDKLIIVGPYQVMGNSFKAEDQILTPVGKHFGVELHATVLGNLLDQSWIKSSPKWDRPFLAITTMYLVYLSLYLPPRWGTLCLILSSVGVFAGSYYAFINNIFLPCFIQSLVVSPLILVGILAFNFYHQYQRVREIELALGISLKPPKR